MANDDVEISVNELDTWLRGYERAWESKDPDAAASLFTADAHYFETPYSEPFQGPDGVRAYWTRVTADQRDIDFQYAIVTVDGNRGIATWSARFSTISSNAKVELNGIFVLDFAREGRCRQLREWWHAR